MKLTKRKAMKQFGGEVLFLDRSDINTDEIIPAIAVAAAVAGLIR